MPALNTVTITPPSLKYYIKQLGQGAPSYEVKTPTELYEALEKLGHQKPLTFALDLGLLGHMTLSFLGCEDEEHPKFNYDFETCVQVIAEFLEEAHNYEVNAYAQCTFGPNNVILVSFPKRMYFPFQRISVEGLQEGNTPIRIHHVITHLYEDTPEEKRQLITELKSKVAFMTEEHALINVIKPMFII